MWNLLGYREDPKEKTLIPVTIINHYYHAGKKLPYLIAVDELGNFYNESIGHFKSQNKIGFLKGE